MPAVPTATIKTWFESQDKPTQQQFWDWLDSMRNTLVPIPAGDISGLVSVIDDRVAQLGGGGGGGTSIYTPVSLGVSGSQTYALDAEVLAKDFIVIPLAAGKIDIGTTVGGEELASVIADNTDPIFIDTSLFSLTAQTLHFTGQFQVRFITADYGA